MKESFAEFEEPLAEEVEEPLAEEVEEPLAEEVEEPLILEDSCRVEDATSSRTGYKRVSSLDVSESEPESEDEDEDEESEDEDVDIIDDRYRESTKK